MTSRKYKNTAKSERISIGQVRPPFRVINGQIVHAKHDGTKWVW